MTYSYRDDNDDEELNPDRVLRAMDGAGRGDTLFKGGRSTGDDADEELDVDDGPHLDKRSQDDNQAVPLLALDRLRIGKLKGKGRPPSFQGHSNDNDDDPSYSSGASTPTHNPQGDARAPFRGSGYSPSPQHRPSHLSSTSSASRPHRPNFEKLTVNGGWNSDADGPTRRPNSPRLQSHFSAFADPTSSPPLSPALGATIGSLGRSGRSAARWWSPTSQRRIHPLALGPAFLLGVLLAFSGLLTSNPDSNVISRKLNSWLPHAKGQDPLGSLDPRPPYVSHDSGHIFMDQARTSLGAIEHPIHALIRNASLQWDQLVSRQSKTLEDAVKQYRLRYGKHPPKGFDRWYRFATERKVVLIDEYDQIDRDITPFLSLSRPLLAERLRKEQNDPFTHTFVIKAGKLDIIGAKKELGRAKDQAELIQPFLKLLPDVNITMSAHDGPSVLLDRALRDKHESYGKQKKILEDAVANAVDDDLAIWGWSLACPSDSRLRRGYDGLEYGALPSGPSFVQNHIRTMDMCANPEWQYMHGFTSWQGPRPKVLRPLFSFAKTSMHSDILCVPLEQFVNTPSSDPAWEDKKHAKIIWRGSMTGVWYEGTSWWRTSQRSRLHFLSQATSGQRWVRFTSRDPKTGGEVIREEEVDLPRLNERYLDAGYVGDLHQCTPDEGGCEAIPKHIKTVKGMDWESQNDYKYIVDMDGNAWSGRFHRLMASNSLVLKSTIFPEWYSERIMPWVHYVPVKIDYTDLYDLMAFFAGDLDGKGGHDDLAKQIAYNGKQWTEQHWRWEDMQAYAFRLYLEWARVTAENQSDVDYVG